MRRASCFFVVLMCAAILLPSIVTAGNNPSLGIGGYYQKTLGDIKEDESFDEDAISWLLAWQSDLSKWFALELDLEFTLDYGGSDEILYLPQGYLLAGDKLYAGAGIGMGYLDGSWADDPMYAFRLGLNIPLGQRFAIDINANYRFQNSAAFDDIDGEDADSITFGALLRFSY